MAEQHPLWVVCDTSGSMNEGGKRLLAHGLISYLQQAERLWRKAPFLRVVMWGETLESNEYRTDAELPRFRCLGKASADTLAAVLAPLLAQSSRARLLLLSDGQWSRGEVSRLAQWRGAHPDLSIRVVALGSDANLRALGQFAGEVAVYPAEAIAAIMSSWTVGPACLQKGEDR